MTKLDESFVKAAKEEHPEASYYIDTLAEEVRRLEKLLAEAIQYLREGKNKFAPHTTNSFVDDFLARNEAMKNV